MHRVRKGAGGNSYRHGDSSYTNGGGHGDAHARAGCPNIAAGDSADDATTAASTDRSSDAGVLHAYAATAADSHVAADPLPDVHANTCPLSLEQGLQERTRARAGRVL